MLCDQQLDAVLLCRKPRKLKMPRDFAKQAGTKSTKQKPALKRRNNSLPESRGLRDFFWGSCFGIFLSVLGFYFFGTTASEDLIELVAQKGTSIPEIIYENDSFDFDKKLKSNKIEGDAALYSTPNAETQLPQTYRIQAASLSDKEKADQLRAELLLAGLEATTKRSDINGKNWYRVVIGPFDRKVEADRAMTKLREKNLAAILLKETKTN